MYLGRFIVVFPLCFVLGSEDGHTRCFVAATVAWSHIKPSRHILQVDPNTILVSTSTSILKVFLQAPVRGPPCSGRLLDSGGVCSMSPWFVCGIEWV